MSNVGSEPVLATLVALVGIALTSAGVFTHTGVALAPGSLLALIGGAWLGAVLARRNVRLLPGTRIVDPHDSDPAAR